MKPFWIQFNYGNGKFIEKEFFSEEEFYIYLDMEWTPEVLSWKRVKEDE